jgi:hypothetical protein
VPPEDNQDPEQPPQPPDPNDPNNITIETPPPPTPPRQQRSGEPPQVFTPEDVERIRQEERAKFSPLSAQLDDLNAEIARYRQTDEERAKAEEKIRKDAEKAQKKKEEEEMELRDLISRKDQEWEEKLAAERAEREKALAVLDQERRHAALSNYLAQRMLEVGDSIAPPLRKLVSGNSEAEIETKISELVEISENILGETNRFIAEQNAHRPMVGVTAPPIGPPDMAAVTRTYTPDDIKNMTPEEYAALREGPNGLLAAASKYRRQ